MSAALNLNEHKHSHFIWLRVNDYFALCANPSPLPELARRSTCCKVTRWSCGRLSLFGPSHPEPHSTSVLKSGVMGWTVWWDKKINIQKIVLLVLKLIRFGPMWNIIAGLYLAFKHLWCNNTADNLIEYTIRNTNNGKERKKLPSKELNKTSL